jgi:hypothetical protein
MSRDVDEHTIQALWGNSGFDFVSKNSNGKSGGIIVVWDKYRFSRTSWKEGDGFIAVTGIWLPINAPCLIIVVYAPQSINSKRVLWNNLNMLISTHDCLTVIIGDFNEVRNASERLGSTFCRKGASIFNEFISSSGLSEIPMGGTLFTRMNRIGSKLAKLDRFLVSAQFLNRWPNAHVITLTKEFSDHSPLLLHVSSGDFGPIPFKFYNSWLHHSDFNSILMDCWSNSTYGSITKAETFKKKLQHLKTVIKEWRKSVVLLENTSSASLRDTLDSIDKKAESSSLSSVDIDTRSNTVKALSDLEHLKIKDLRQKAKCRWALEGDENSRFFHGLMNSNRNWSRINGFNINGVWTTNPLQIKEHVFTTFKLKFKENFSWRPSFSSNLFKTLSLEDVSLLDQPFSIQEIKDAIWSCGGEKAPGPDGFSFKFIKKHWNLLSSDIISYVKEFESSNFIPIGCNSSFITLVPKTEDPLSINDFRPISLIGCQYKIIAKILANRLASVISSIVSEDHGLISGTPLLRM